MMRLRKNGETALATLLDTYLKNRLHGAVSISLEIDDDIVRAFPDDGKTPHRRVIESVVLTLFREGDISTGKLAELLGLPHSNTAGFLHRHGLIETPTSEEIGRDSEFLKDFLIG